MNVENILEKIYAIKKNLNIKNLSSRVTNDMKQHEFILYLIIFWLSVFDLW